ncbi:MAG: hypothetical protein A3G76_16890 [Acidobacteria bacterium RIFCSPLOWO2_12_FULL_65_11]|nr:MAG: hypothetical protein A3G76_16890 [Acidobacteria bacterium RIFCSPLOWO2_12_FULL_65_11]
MIARLIRATSCVVLLVLGTVTATAQGPIRIRVGTVVPQGSLWHETLQRISQEWRRVVGARLTMTILAGGTLGDEAEMVRQARQGRIQAVGLSSVGLSRIDAGVACLQVPMLLKSYEELDYVRDRVAPELERRIEAKGFKVLHWADGGWVYAFTKRPATTPAELRQMKLFTSAGDPEAEALYKDFGYSVVPLSMTDLVPMLQSGTVDAFAIVPLFAQLQELFKLAPNMTDVKWTPLVGGTVITQVAWDSLPNEHKSALLEAARTQGALLRNEIRRMDGVAIVEMQKRGLKVVAVDDATDRAWQAEAEKAYPKLRGRYCPADLFDTVVRLRDEYRRSRPAAGAATGR